MLVKTTVFLQNLGEGTRVRTMNFIHKANFTPGSVDKSDAAAAIANSLKTRLTTKTKITKIKFSVVRSTPQQKVGKRDFQTCKMAVAGIVAIDPSVDLAIQQEVLVFSASPIGGRDSQYKLPFGVSEVQAQAAPGGAPELVGITAQSLQDWWVAFTGILNGNVGPIGIPGDGANIETSFGAHEIFKYLKFAAYSINRNRVSSRTKLTQYIKSVLGELNKSYRAELRRIDGTTAKADPQLVAQIQQQYGELVADNGADKVKAAKIPYPLNTLVGTGT